MHHRPAARPAARTAAGLVVGVVVALAITVVVRFGDHEPPVSAEGPSSIVDRSTATVALAANERHDEVFASDGRRGETATAAMPQPMVDPIEEGRGGRTIAGNVIDTDGRPIDGAMLAIRVPVDGGDIADVQRTQWLAFSDHDGAFVFSAMPGLAAARLCTQHPGHRTDERALPLGANVVTVVLTALPHEEPLCGTVFGPDGGPLPGARVRMGDAATTSDDDGTFTIDGSRVPAGTPLFVFASECTPVRRDDPRPRDGRAAAPLLVSLQPAVEIVGRIVDAAGVPLPDWTVVLADPTLPDPQRPFAASVEGELAPTRAVTDQAGGFVFRGVFVRRYTIEAWDRGGERGLAAQAAPSDGIVTLVASERVPTTLRGVVIADDGRPVAGAIVGEERPGCRADGALAMRFDHRVRSAVDGSFELPLRGAALRLVVDGDTIVPRRFTLSTLAVDAPIRIDVVRRRAVRVAGRDTMEELQLGPVGDGASVLECVMPGPTTFAMPANARRIAVRRHGVVVGTVPLPANGAPMLLRVEPAAR